MKSVNRDPMPRVSVITPSFNQGQFLEETITSVLSQSYRAIEYIVMDGGSTDNSIQVIEKHSNRLSAWSSRPDLGQADAIRRGFERSTGELLCWVNSDDVLLPNAIQELVALYNKRPDLDLFIGASLLVGPDSKPLIGKFGSARIYATRGYVHGWRIRHHGAAFLQPGTLWTRSAYMRVGGVDPSFKFCMDRDLFIRLTMRKPALATPTVVARYRLHSSSKTSTMLNVRREEGLVINNKYLAGESVVKIVIYRALCFMWHRWEFITLFIARKCKAARKW